MMNILRLGSALVRARRGIAAVEFALVVPFLLTMAVGLVETTRYVRIRASFNQAAAAMADLVATQQGVLSGPNGTLVDLCKGAKYVMAPYSTATLGISVASYTNSQTGSGVGKDWEYDSACPTTVAMSSAPTTVPQNDMVANAGDSVITIYAVYTYTPLISTVLPTVTFRQVLSARPRFGTVVCSNC